MEESTFQMKTLQDYEVISVIGSGAFGTCFKVRDKDSGAIYAWKGMDYDELSETKKESLISEINVLRQLKHPNIVQYHHHIVNHETKSIFIVMECCEGGDLSQLIDKCRTEKLRFEEKYIWRILFQICKALQVCHNKIKDGTILHRDIKPANIFLDSEGNAKLGDFGLARVLRRNENFAQTFVGTPYYMSPEIVKGSKYDRKSDVWAVGCLIYEMCSLRPPFKGRQFEQLSKNISGGKFNCIPGCYSSDMQEIISFMLEVENDSRPSIDIITRHPVLVRNVVEIPNEFPKLIAIEELADDYKWKLTFTPREDLSSTALTHFTVDGEMDKHVTGVSTPALRSELFNSPSSFRRKIKPRTLNCSDPELYESIRAFEVDEAVEPTIKPTTAGYSPTVITQTIFEKTLQDRLQAIRAHESLLKHREANLLVREKNLNEREKRIQEMERNLEVKQAAMELMSKRVRIERKPKPPRRTLSTRNIAPIRDSNDTYCSIEPNDTIVAPTVAKLDFAAMPPPKPLMARKVTFKSPKKFTKYDIENIPPDAGRDSKFTLRSSVSSKTSEESDGGHSHKRKSILSIFGLSKANKDNKPTTTMPIPKREETKNSPEVIDKCQPEELSSVWTLENKRAAFDMLAAMNAAAEKVGDGDLEQISSRKCRQSVHERGASLRRSQLIRRSVIGLSTGLMTKVPEHGSRIIV